MENPPVRHGGYEAALRPALFAAVVFQGPNDQNRASRGTSKAFLIVWRAFWGSNDQNRIPIRLVKTFFAHEKVFSVSERSAPRIDMSSLRGQPDYCLELVFLLNLEVSTDQIREKTVCRRTYAAQKGVTFSNRTRRMQYRRNYGITSACGTWRMRSCYATSMY
jgi:hypothetical protein